MLPGPRYLSTIPEVHDLVATVLQAGAFAFDVETLGVLEHHPDLGEFVEQQVRSHVLGLKTLSESVIDRTRATKVEATTKSIALDPHRNEVIWVGIATSEHSWAIPVGHPNCPSPVPSLPQLRRNSYVYSVDVCWRSASCLAASPLT